MRCFVPGCQNKNQRFGTTLETYHTWTKKPKYQQIWLEVLGMDHIPKGRASICSVHFDDPADFSVYHHSNIDQRQLLPTAVPKYHLGPRTYASDKIQNAAHVQEEAAEKQAESDTTAPKAIETVLIVTDFADELEFESEENDATSMMTGNNGINTNLVSEEHTSKESVMIVNEFAEKINQKCQSNENEISNEMCRVCLQKSPFLHHPLFDDGEVTLAGQRLARLVQFDLRSDDGLPKIICQKCNYRLDQFVEFQHLATAMHLKLLNAVRNGKTVSLVKRTPPITDSVDDDDDRTKDPDWDDNAAPRCPKDDLIKCPVCGKCLKPISMTIHLRRHSGRPEKCHLCTKSFVTSYELKKHLRTHKNTSKFVCNKCDAGFPTLPNYRAHVIICNSKDIMTPIRPHPKETHWNYMCELCSVGYETRTELKNHFKSQTHQDKRPDAHLKDNKIPYLDPDKDGYVVCPICSKRLKQCSISMHLLRHTNTRAFKCEVCPKSFIDKFNLVKHLERHKKDRRFVCDKCDAGFRFDHLLDIHTLQCKVQVRNSPECGAPEHWTCAPCSVEFDSKLELQNHLRSLTHLENNIPAKPYSVDIKEEFLE